MEALTGLSPILGQLGGLGVAAVVIWYLIRGGRQDRNSLDAQTHSAAIALIQEARAERGMLRGELKDMREAHTRELSEARQELTGVRERLAVLERRQQDHLTVLQAHAAWDALVIDAHGRMMTRLTECGQSPESLRDFYIGNPPALYPWRPPSADRPRGARSHTDDGGASTSATTDPTSPSGGVARTTD